LETILKKMQNTVIKYANVLSDVLKVDIEIVDHNLNRIAGTGQFTGKINIDMSKEGYVYRKVIETGEQKVIKYPGKHALCVSCPKRSKCEEIFEMSTPIKLGARVIGVIGFVCFDNSQRRHIINNFDTFSNFLEQIGELMSSKAKEELENEKTHLLVELLNHIVDKVEDGVVIIDKSNKTMRINERAKSILGGINENIPSFIIRPTGNSILNKKEYEVAVDNIKHIVLGEEYLIELDDGNFNKIFIFNDIRQKKEEFFSLTNTGKDIGLEEIVGVSQEISKLKRDTLKVSRNSSTVLITGESGTGKELFARAIHLNSAQAKGPFVTINCGAIPDSLLESELFGYVKGAFTGANQGGKIGKFEFADKGTIFLDEIADLPLYMQVKLLRVLQERKITRIGSNVSIEVDVRIIAATNRDLEEMISERTFREDLYFRINVIPLNIPPLRERKEDIKVLALHFINKYSQLLQKNVMEIAADFWERLYGYKWPGNVRELENAIEFMINMMDNSGILSADLLPKKILTVGRNEFSQEQEEVLNLNQVEKLTIAKALQIYGTTTKGKQAAAQALGIGTATLYRKMDLYRLSHR
jgi:sigma-54 dependent transcriptional regulator, acetoin dehydrogenase operon transcriptional activator AcoR